MASIYYCTDAQLTDLLPDLTDSEIDTSAKRDTKIRAPAREWIDSVYPEFAPFPNIAAAAEEWAVNQTNHAAGDESVTVDGGSNAPAVGDWFRVEHQNVLYKVSAYSANVVTYESNPPEWNMAARDDFPDNARLFFGTPALIQEAARWFGVGLAFSILRDNPLNEAAAAAKSYAKELIQVPASGGPAQAAPWPRTPWADDSAYSAPFDFMVGEARLVR